MKLTEQQLSAARAFIDRHEQQMVDAVCRLVRIPSVSAPCSDPTAPYGLPCRQVLDEMTALCAEQGYTMQNHQNRCATLRVGDAAQELGIFCHLDVVPGGAGWAGDPFVPVVRDGFIVGRGAIDNKGSAVIGLFALACLRELGIELRHAVRLFCGCNEEDMMTDVAWYGQQFGWPDWTLVPDSMFPAAFAEKGIFAGSVVSRVRAKTIRALKAGVASNVVPDRCEIALDACHYEALLPHQSEQLAVTREGGQTLLRASGRSAHASMPEQSCNAIGIAFAALLAADVLQGEERDAVAFWQKLLCDFTGASLGLQNDAGAYGQLTIIGALASLDLQGHFCFGFNCRYPANDHTERLEPLMRAACAANGFALTVEEGIDGFALSPTHPVVTAMTGLFNRLAGENRAPFLMRGASYCRMMPNAIPFGPELVNTAPSFPPGRGGIHQPDEALRIAEMKSAAVIYVAALAELDALI